TCAMPCPIVPAPTTPIERISRLIDSLRYTNPRRHPPRGGPSVAAGPGGGQGEGRGAPRSDRERELLLLDLLGGIGARDGERRVQLLGSRRFRPGQGAFPVERLETGSGLPGRSDIDRHQFQVLQLLRGPGPGAALLVV